MEYRYKIAAQAGRDLQNIWRYIARDNPGAAAHFCRELLDEAESFRFSPFRGQSLQGHAETRKVVHGSYLIFYEVNEAGRQVEILRFWHGARNRRGMRLKEEAADYGRSATPVPLVPASA